MSRRRKASAGKAWNAISLKHNNKIHRTQFTRNSNLSNPVCQSDTTFRANYLRDLGFGLTQWILWNRALFYIIVDSFF